MLFRSRKSGGVDLVTTDRNRFCTDLELAADLTPDLFSERIESHSIPHSLRSGKVKKISKCEKN